MQIFRANKKIFWANELKSWFLTFAFALALYFGVQLFFSISADNRMMGVTLLLLLKIAEVITPYRVTEIGIDKDKDQLKFRLFSRMSGVKLITYDLRHVSSDLVHHSGLMKYLSSPLTLKILVTEKDMFRINSRFGFSAKTLVSIDRTLKSLSTSNTTS